MFKNQYLFKQNIKLLNAVKENDVYAVQSLLDHYANVNVKIDKEIIDEWQNNYTKGSTPLMIAASNNNKRIVQALLNKGADINARDKDGHTALMVAVRGCKFNPHPLADTETTQILLESGADINARDNNGWTALMYAVEKGHMANVKILLDKGADKSIINKDGYSAEEISIFIKDEDKYGELYRNIYNLILGLSIEGKPIRGSTTSGPIVTTTTGAITPTEGVEEDVSDGEFEDVSEPEQGVIENNPD